MSPDVCKSPDKPVPYMSWGEASDDQNYSPDVRSNGKIIKRQDSKFSCCYGDEPGVGLGCKSNTVGDVVEPVTSSQIVRANGIWVQRHGDRCTLNKGNTEGEYVHVEATDAHKAPEGTDNQDQSGGKAEDTRSEGQKFSDGLTENASETWEGRTAEVAQNLYDDPGATLGRGWENAQNTASSIWHAVADPYSEAYEKGGLSQAIGRHLRCCETRRRSLGNQGSGHRRRKDRIDRRGGRRQGAQNRRGCGNHQRCAENRIEGRGWRARSEKHAEAEGAVFRSAARGQSRRVQTSAERTAGND
ncbi:MAG TPA: DUF4150 domain-containing protein [Rhizobium sp.]|nr:DUF4150 domain-containing protein [Rhizobium sp.]